MFQIDLRISGVKFKHLSTYLYTEELFNFCFPNKIFLFSHLVTNKNSQVKGRVVTKQI